jgi:hypothetical protein
MPSRDMNTHALVAGIVVFMKNSLDELPETFILHVSLLYVITGL